MDLLSLGGVRLVGVRLFAGPKAQKAGGYP